MEKSILIVEHFMVQGIRIKTRENRIFSMDISTSLGVETSHAKHLAIDKGEAKEIVEFLRMRDVKECTIQGVNYDSDSHQISMLGEDLRSFQTIYELGSSLWDTWYSALSEFADK